MAENEKKNDILELAPVTVLPESEEEQQGFWGKMKRGLFMTHTEIIEKMSSAMEGKVALDERTLEYLEEILISCDLGVETALELVERVKKNATKEQAASPLKLRKLLSDEIAELLRDSPKPRIFSRAPLLTLVIGVNGVGKTTSIAKIAKRSLQEKNRVLLAAGDTFRAAAIEQLALWGDRLGIEVIRQGQGADPGAVIYDAIHAANARKMNHLIVDNREPPSPPMNLADVFTVFFILVGFVITFVAYWLLSAGLFPAFVERSAARLEKAPLKTFLLGAVTLLPLLVIGFAASGKSTNAALKVLALSLVLLPALAALFGSAGWALRVGQGLRAARDDEDPWRRVLRGGIVVGLAFVLPFVGTFVVLPFVFLSGFGAFLTVCRSPRPAAIPASSSAPARLPEPELSEVL